MFLATGLHLVLCLLQLPSVPSQRKPDVVRRQLFSAASVRGSFTSPCSTLFFFPRRDPALKPAHKVPSHQSHNTDHLRKSGIEDHSQNATERSKFSTVQGHAVLLWISGSIPMNHSVLMTTIKALTTRVAHFHFTLCLTGRISLVTTCLGTPFLRETSSAHMPVLMWCTSDSSATGQSALV